MHGRILTEPRRSIAMMMAAVLSDTLRMPHAAIAYILCQIMCAAIRILTAAHFRANAIPTAVCADIHIDGTQQLIMIKSDSYRLLSLYNVFRF
jgi:hypothetical protein